MQQAIRLLRCGLTCHRSRVVFHNLPKRDATRSHQASTFYRSTVHGSVTRHSLSTGRDLPGQERPSKARPDATADSDFVDVHPVTLRSGRYSGRPWSSTEDTLLREAVSLHGHDWAKAAAHVGNRRTNRGCRQRWLLRLGNVNKGPFTRVEMARIHDFLREYPKQWTKVASLLGSGHSADQVRDFVMGGGGLSNNLRVWTAEEDDTLRKAVEKHGVGKWAAVAGTLTGRNDASCYSRWTFSLDPQLVRGAWSAEEDRRLLAAVEALKKSGEPFHFGDVAVLMENRRHRKACRQRYKRLMGKPNG